MTTKTAIEQEDDDLDKFDREVEVFLRFQLAIPLLDVLDIDTDEHLLTDEQIIAIIERRVQDNPGQFLLNEIDSPEVDVNYSSTAE